MYFVLHRVPAVVGQEPEAVADLLEQIAVQVPLIVAGKFVVPVEQMLLAAQVLTAAVALEQAAVVARELLVEAQVPLVAVRKQVPVLVEPVRKQVAVLAELVHKPVAAEVRTSSLLLVE